MADRRSYTVLEFTKANFLSKFWTRDFPTVMMEYTAGPNPNNLIANLEVTAEDVLGNKIVYKFFIPENDSVLVDYNENIIHVPAQPLSPSGT